MSEVGLYRNNSWILNKITKNGKQNWTKNQKQRILIIMY